MTDIKLKFSTIIIRRFCGIKTCQIIFLVGILSIFPEIFTLKEVQKLSISSHDGNNTSTIKATKEPIKAKKKIPSKIKVKILDFTKPDQLKLALATYFKSSKEYLKAYNTTKPKFDKISLKFLKFPYHFEIQPIKPRCFPLPKSTKKSDKSKLTPAPSNDLLRILNGLSKAFRPHDTRLTIFPAHLSRIIRDYKTTLVVKPKVLIVVHSAALNWARREIIRDTWASKLSLLTPPHTIVIRFFVGLPSKTDEKVVGNYNSSSLINLQRAILAESNAYGDLVQANYVDSYSNLTLKAYSWLAWVLQNCQKSSGMTFVLKTDDDIIINMPLLYKHLSSMMQHKEIPKRAIICLVWEGMEVWRKSKWAVSLADYPYKHYPSYCSGSSYILTGDAIEPLYRHYHAFRYMWIDDVFVTGFVSHLAKVKLIRSNTLYNLKEKNKTSHINSFNALNLHASIAKSQAIPSFERWSPNIPIFSHVPSNPGVSRELWKSIMRSYYNRDEVSMHGPLQEIKSALSPLQNLTRLYGSLARYRKIRGLYNVVKD